MDDIKIDDNTLTRSHILENMNKYMLVYKLSDSLFSDIKNYLDTKPMGEVNRFFNYIFDQKNHNRIASFFDMDQLITYLYNKCPRGEVSDFFFKFNDKNHLTEYAIERSKNKEYVEAIESRIKAYAADMDNIKSVIKNYINERQ